MTYIFTATNQSEFNHRKIKKESADLFAVDDISSIVYDCKTQSPLITYGIMLYHKCFICVICYININKIVLLLIDLNFRFT